MSKGDYIGLITAIFLVLLVFSGLGYLVYIMQQVDAPPIPKWDNGTIVRSVLSKQKGMIITLRCWGGQPACYYDVRFAGLQSTTNTRIFSDDGAIENEPLLVVKGMREYELEEISQGE